MRIGQSGAVIACLSLRVALVCAQSENPATVPSGSSWTPAAISGKAHQQWKWLLVAGELRSRAEAPAALEFREGDDDVYLLTRLRLSTLVTARPWLKFFGEWQDSRAPGFNRPVPGSMDNSLDLRQAYVDVGATEGRGWGVRMGRQALKFGKGRMVWDPDWANTGRAFDGARVSFGGRHVHLDAFATTVVVPRNRFFDRSDTSNMFYGLYGAVERWGTALRVETYVFLKSNAAVRNELGRTGALDLYTAGFRGAGVCAGTLDWEVEIASQSGRLAGRRVRAVGGVWVVGWKTGTGAWHPRVSAGYTYASGDKNSADGLKGTFDALFPTIHLRNGATDRLGWANIHDVMLQADWKPSRKLKLNTGWHDFRLATTTDALYGAGGGALFRNARASSGHVGFEFFGTAEYSLTRTLSFGSGYAHLFRGAFLRESSRGCATQPYLLLTYRF
ncbi:MAG TPA: alginate export family protein [Bryobacteraceae bacterium]|nr:alginate export family protein [Bryobacteraceae bacterium]